MQKGISVFLFTFMIISFLLPARHITAEETINEN